MTTTENLTTMTPAAIDTILAALDMKAYAASQKAGQYDKAAEAAAEGSKYQRPDLERAAKYTATAAEFHAVNAAIRAEMAPFNAEFTNRGGWTRAFLVTNSGGHVHRDMSCSTCFVTTQYAWMVDYSGKDEAEIVDAAGEIACTVCYPSAPVSVLGQPTKMFSSPEAKAKAEKKAAAEAAKCAGSGTWDYPDETARRGYCAGNYGVCTHCDEAITITSTGKMRQHKGK